MSSEGSFVIGLDLGTSGARAVAASPEGVVLASATHITPAPFMDENGVSEQVADGWKVAGFAALAKCIRILREHGVALSGLAALCVDGTSGSIVFLDENNRPLYPGLMHNDTRAAEEANELNQLLEAHCREVGYRFNPSFALPKILWFKRHKRLLFSKVRRVAHQADYMVGELVGRYDLSDPANALKTGFNLVRQDWPEELDKLGVRELLPSVRPSGEVIGEVLPEVAEEMGIPRQARVVAGLTDSNASFLATGASLPGEFSVSLGTTLAFKGLWTDLVHDSSGAVYCHRHPNGHWLPGGASNVGGACLKFFFPDQDLGILDTEALARFPTEVACYPLVEVGERFPFVSTSADGYYQQPGDEIDQYLSLLQGVAFVEKWCFAKFRELGIEVRGPVYSTGGGARSDTWSQVRANILQIPVARCSSTDSAFGAAVLAATTVFHGGDFERAGKAMTGVSRVFEPDPKWDVWAEEKLAEIQANCGRLGWI